jgi:hypothetical protein
MLPGEIRVYAATDRPGELNARLVQAGIVVDGIGVTQRRLEEYFVALTGGAA